MRDIKDICISSCFPLAWAKEFKAIKMDYSKLVYVGKKRVRHRCGRKMTYCDEYVYWYPETIFGVKFKPIDEGEYFRSTILLGE